MVNAQANYIDDNNAYVDAVGNENTTNNVVDAPAGSQVNSANANYRDQFSMGLLNYGYVESLYYQFSGEEEAFKNGNSLQNNFSNITWIYIKPLDYKIPPAWAFGLDFLYFTSTSESVYSGESDIIASSIDMQMFMLSISVRVFFMDPYEKLLHPYVGLGWGMLTGEFKTTKKDIGSKHQTSFTGPLSYQIIGIQVKMGDRYGINGEFKILRAYATTSNDPFSQGNSNTLDLSLDGVIIGLTGYYRF
ncbi:hypothetical protein KKA14_03215 [bacterium]|nr:hypothetical protein [bacterium]